eukprot:6335029-Prymnesium_polylepis.4
MATFDRQEAVLPRRESYRNASTMSTQDARKDQKLGRLRCNGYGSPHTGKGEEHLGHHPKKAGPRWGAHLGLHRARRAPQ